MTNTQHVVHAEPFLRPIYKPSSYLIGLCPCVLLQQNVHNIIANAITDLEVVVLVRRGTQFVHLMSDICPAATDMSVILCDGDIDGR